MPRITKPPVLDDLDYPTSDGRPMAETDWHRLRREIEELRRRRNGR